MLKNIKKYIPKRKYRERGQLERRKKLGFLEKKQDYKVRAEDYHKKEERYRKLKEAARTKNPDEFYHKMVKAKIIDGEHVQDAEEKALTDKILTNNQFINLVNYKKSKLEKEAEKIKVDLQLNANLFSKGKPKQIFFADENDDINLLGNKTERDHEVNKEKLGKLKQKLKNVEQLTAISKGLTEQKELIQPGKRKKLEDGSYKYFIERKK